MDESSISHSRRSPRANLLMAASLEHGGDRVAVTLRNLSAEGALVQGDLGLTPGACVIFRKNELAVSGRIAWAEGNRVGIAFDMALDPATVLRHVPAPRKRREAASNLPRPRRAVAMEERQFGRKVVAENPPGPEQAP